MADTAVAAMVGGVLVPAHMAEKYCRSFTSQPHDPVMRDKALQAYYPRTISNKRSVLFFLAYPDCIQIVWTAKKNKSDPNQRRFEMRFQNRLLQTRLSPAALAAQIVSFFWVTCNATHNIKSRVMEVLEFMLLLAERQITY